MLSGEKNKNIHESRLQRYFLVWSWPPRVTQSPQMSFSFFTTKTPQSMGFWPLPTTPALCCSPSHQRNFFSLLSLGFNLIIQWITANRRARSKTAQKAKICWNWPLETLGEHQDRDNISHKPNLSSAPALRPRWCPGTWARMTEMMVGVVVQSQC